MPFPKSALYKQASGKPQVSGRIEPFTPDLHSQLPAPDT